MLAAVSEARHVDTYRLPALAMRQLDYLVIAGESRIKSHPWKPHQPSFMCVSR